MSRNSSSKKHIEKHIQQGNVSNDDRRQARERKKDYLIDAIQTVIDDMPSHNFTWESNAMFSSMQQTHRRTFYHFCFLVSNVIALFEMDGTKMPCELITHMRNWRIAHVDYATFLELPIWESELSRGYGELFIILQDKYGIKFANKL